MKRLFNVPLLVTIAIVLVIAFAPSLFGVRGMPRERAALGDIAALEQAVAMYAADCPGELPSNLAELANPCYKQQYIRELCKDPWGTDYVYVPYAETGLFVLFSAGPNGIAGDKDDVTGIESKIRNR